MSDLNMKEKPLVDFVTEFPVEMISIHYLVNII